MTGAGRAPARLQQRAEPTLGGLWVRLLVDALARAGFDAPAYCRQRGWDVSDPAHGHARVPWSDIVALWAEAARTTGDPALGLHAALNPPFRAEGPLGYLIMSSATLGEGLSLMARYQALHFDGRGVSLEERGDDVALVLTLPERPPPLPHQAEYVCAMLKRTCAWVAGPAFRLSRVDFGHAAPASPAEHGHAFGCPVEFRRAENALVLDRRMLALPSLYANPEVLATVRAVAERRLSAQQRRPWAERVRIALEGDLRASIEGIARRLGVSGRSVQRKLAAEGARFDQLLDEARRQEALERVRRGGEALGDLAATLGFADVRSFGRAFRRWTGVTPSAYRAQMSPPGEEAGPEDPPTDHRAT